MAECGIRGPLHSWYREYLAERSHRVRVGEEHSRPQAAAGRGVPQGSGCGPLCYLMHVNSLCNVIRHCSSYMFADDLCTLRAGRDMDEVARLVQEDIDNVVRWSHDNGIVLNAEKTNLLVIQSPYSCTPTSICQLVAHSFDCFHNKCVNCKCTTIKQVPCVTYLGMCIDEKMGWTKHIEKILNKLRILLFKFKQLSFKVPISVLKTIYLSLVDSIISYGLDCYGSIFKTYMDKIENIQIKFLKLLVSKNIRKKYSNNNKALFSICKILPASLKYKYLIAINSHSTPDHKIPIHHGLNTRAAAQGKYQTVKVNNYFGGRLLQRRIPLLYNEMPIHIRNEPNKNTFSRLYKTFLLQSIAM
ncbi:hypothetical protein JYU34_004728 [Plutella xylostella]|uniref:Reverse transcriptase domain-containing protein n=1 Tax=Plutella xylostella TaxID=51655 RepID=A0ABQ7QYQ3_PLUXY|nr:hypothetical protein JYU34_004728 [Plutella xylostella]